MRIALVFPPFYHPAMYNLPPLGLINLATGLKLAGHEPGIVDLVLGDPHRGFAARCRHLSELPHA